MAMLDHVRSWLYVGWIEVFWDFVGLPGLYGFKSIRLTAWWSLIHLNSYKLDGSVTSFPEMDNELGFLRDRGPLLQGPGGLLIWSFQMNVGRLIKLTLITRFSLILYVGGAWSAKLNMIGPQAWVGAQGGRAGALPPGPIGFPFVPVASRLF